MTAPSVAPGWALAVAALLAGLIVATRALGIRGVAVRSEPGARLSTGATRTAASGTRMSPSRRQSQCWDPAPPRSPGLQMAGRVTLAFSWDALPGRRE